MPLEQHHPCQLTMRSSRPITPLLLVSTEFFLTILMEEKKTIIEHLLEFSCQQNECV